MVRLVFHAISTKVCPRFFARLWLLLILCPGIANVVMCQSQPESETNEFTDPAFFTGEEIEVIAAEEYSESYEALQRDPVRINEKEPLDLARLFFLDHEQLNNLFLYLVLGGPILSVYELMAVEGVSREVAQRLAAVISLETRMPLPWDVSVIEKAKIKQEFKINMTGRFDEIFCGLLPAQEAAGPAVSPIRLRMRYALKVSNGFDVAIAGETDPGEVLPFSRDSKGLDFYSAYIAYRGKGLLKHIVLGDYQLSAGQGLWLWNAFMPKGTTIGSGGWMLASKGLIPVARSSEGSFFRGGAAWLQHSRFFIIPFLSAAGQRSQSLTSGYMAGLYAGYRGECLEIGAGWLKCNKDILPDYKFSGAWGKSHFLLNDDKPGIHVKYRNRAALIYGEAAYASLSAKRPHWLLGLEWRVLPLVSVSMQYYSYPFAADPAAISSSFGGEGADNRRGVRLGFKFQTSDQMHWLAGLTLVNALPVPGQVPEMGKSMVGSLSSTYTQRSGMSLAVRFRYRSSILQPEAGGFPLPASANPGRYDIQLALKPGNSIPYEGKLLILADNTKDADWKFAYLLFQQIRFKVMRGNVGLSLSHILFDTDSWDQRLYINNSLVTFSGGFQALSGQGSKACLHLEMKIRRLLRIAAFVSHLAYFDRGRIGSANQFVPGNTRTDVGLQCIFSR